MHLLSTLPGVRNPQVQLLMRKYSVEKYSSYSILIILPFLIFFVYFQTRARTCGERTIGGQLEDSGFRKVPVIQYNSEYCVIPFVLKSNFRSDGEIVLVLHMTTERINHQLINQFKTWSGGVSISILVDSPPLKGRPTPLSPFQRAVIQKLNHMLLENDIVNVDVHFVFQLPADGSGCEAYSLYTATTPRQYNFSALDGVIQHPPMFVDDGWYPVNVLRNVARLFLPRNQLVIVTDTQFLFSINFEEHIAKALLDAKKLGMPFWRCAFVYRIFEAIPDHDGSFPTATNELQAALQQGNARVFHRDTAPESHRIADLDEWLLGNLTASFKEYSYSDASWEPQFVSFNTAPFHHEEFPFLIRDNVNQRWEMCRAGFHFLVVREAFAVHTGIKSNESKADDNRERMTVADRFVSALHGFNEYMNARYPGTRTMCPYLTEQDKPKNAKKPLAQMLSAQRLRAEQLRRERAQRGFRMSNFINALVNFKKADESGWRDNREINPYLKD